MVMSRRHFLKGLLAATAVAAMPFVALPAEASVALEAVKYALKGDFAAAGDAAKRSGDSAAVKLVELIYLRDKGVDARYARIVNFLAAAPKWPLS